MKPNNQQPTTNNRARRALQAKRDNQQPRPKGATSEACQQPTTGGVAKPKKLKQPTQTRMQTNSNPTTNNQQPTTRGDCGAAITTYIHEIVKRVIATASPLKIILFGSAARGEMGPNSDLDILVVMPTGAHRRQTAQKIYRSLIGVGFAADIVVVTEEDIERFKDSDATVIRPAIEEGQVLYAA
ncbi:MAG: nucleotidyltransferase domain-containing protein [bacterium]|nr:nucleotidyltransferase domain-containing protein [bacterium]